MSKAKVNSKVLALRKFGGLDPMKVACTRLPGQRLVDGVGYRVHRGQPEAVVDLLLRLLDQVGLESGS